MREYSNNSMSKEKRSSSKEDKSKKNDKHKYKPRKRQLSPPTSKEQLMTKRIQLITQVSGLPTSWKEDDLQKFFQEHGKILDLKMFKKNSLFTGSALVKFASLSEAEKAIDKLKNTVLPETARAVNMKWLDTQQQRLGIAQHGDHRLFVGSLPRQAGTNTLYQVFSIFGEITTIRLQETQFWAFVDYKKKESALLAIKYLNGQTYLLGSRIPIEVRFKEKKYNSYMAKKHEKEEFDPFAYSIDNVYHEIYHDGQHYYYNYRTKQSQFDPPPPGSRVYNSNAPDGYYIQPKINTLNDMHLQEERKLGPIGSNLFIFHLFCDMKDSDLYNLFKRFGNILSARVITENGKSKGCGFVSFDNCKSAQEAIEDMNGLVVEGKMLKVELNRKDQRAVARHAKSLTEAKNEIS